MILSPIASSKKTNQKVQMSRTIRYLSKILDFFYKPFRKILPEETFRYLFFGGINTSLEAILYFIFYNFIFFKKNISFFDIAITPHVAAFLVVFPIVFFTGFLFSRYFIFTRSSLKSRIQFKRFGVTILLSLLLHYVLLKFFVELLLFFPTPSKVITSALVALFTYLSHRFFTFKTNIV